jgi:hypothetical protein
MREASDREKAGPIFAQRIRGAGRAARSSVPIVCFVLLCVCVIFESSCDGTVGSASSPPPPPPSNIVVTVSPALPTVSTGGAELFRATVTGTAGASTDVTWSVNSTPGGNSTVGTIVLTSATTALYTRACHSSVACGSCGDGHEHTRHLGVWQWNVTIACTATNSISPPSASVAVSQPQRFTASFCQS